MIAGTPPNIFLTGNADIYRDIRDRGLGQTVGRAFRRHRRHRQISRPSVREAIKVDGEVRKIPTGIHIDGIIYYNMKVAEAAGVDPTSWTSVEEMFADMEKVKAAGYNFMAMGGNTFQAGYLFHALMAGIAGPEVYKNSTASTRTASRMQACSRSRACATPSRPSGVSPPRRTTAG